MASPVLRTMFKRLREQIFNQLVGCGLWSVLAAAPFTDAIAKPPIQISLPSSIAANEQLDKWYRTTVYWTNIREAPELASSVVASLMPDVAVILIDIVGNWARVEIPSEPGTSGYVDLALLEKVNDTVSVTAVASPSVVQANRSTDTLYRITEYWTNIREAPDLASPIVTSLKPGVKVVLIDIIGNWARVELPPEVGTSGYADLALLEKIPEKIVTVNPIKHPQLCANLSQSGNLVDIETAELQPKDQIDLPEDSSVQSTNEREVSIPQLETENQAIEPTFMSVRNGLQFRLDAKGNSADDKGQALTEIRVKDLLPLNNRFVFSSAFVNQTVYNANTSSPDLNGQRQGTYLENKLQLITPHSNSSLSVQYALGNYTGPDESDSVVDDALAVSGEVPFSILPVPGIFGFTEYAKTGKDFRRRADILDSDKSKSPFTSRGTEKWTSGVGIKKDSWTVTIDVERSSELGSAVSGTRPSQSGYGMDLIYSKSTQSDATGSAYVSVNFREKKVPWLVSQDDKTLSFSAGSAWNAGLFNSNLDYDFSRYENHQSDNSVSATMYRTVDFSISYYPPTWWAIAYLSSDSSEDDNLNFPFQQIENEVGAEFGFRLRAFPDAFTGMEFYRFDAEYLSGPDQYKFLARHNSYLVGLDFSKYFRKLNGYRSKLRLAVEFKDARAINGSVRPDPESRTSKWGLSLQAGFQPR